ncbi:MAG: menaquinone biosynthesis protein [bacterium]|nr:menaquinone biosynthesis protein [bacterium]
MIELLIPKFKMPVKEKKWTMLPRVGHIKFLNCFPIYYALVKNMDILDMEFIPGLPTELNRLMIEGKLDVSPISSIEYYKNRDKFLLCPHLSVSSNGSVQSILLLSKVPVKKLDGEKISLTDASATSHVLLKIILDTKYKIHPEYFTSKEDLEGMLKNSKAALLIGDKALEESQKLNGLYCYDLGEEWKSLTGKKMVYAVWCIRKEFVEKNPAQAKKLMEAFRKSYEYSVNNIQEIIERASTWEKFSEKFIGKYLRGLDFSFDKAARAGLLEFYSMANEAGLIKGKGNLEFFE